jgi:hypothetical protein
MVGKEAIPKGEVFESVTMRQYIPRFHRTLSKHSLQPAASKEFLREIRNGRSNNYPMKKKIAWSP